MFDSNEVLETKLLAGPYRLRRGGAVGLVPAAADPGRRVPEARQDRCCRISRTSIRRSHAVIEVHDPGNQYGVNYLWGTSGVGYNEAKIRQAMPDAPVDSFAMFYDPNVVKHFKACGVSMLDAPDEMVGTVLLYLGKNPNSESLDDLKAAEQVLLSIRPYIRYINSSRTSRIWPTASSAWRWAGAATSARRGPAPQEDGKGIKISYNIATRGGHHVLRHAGDSGRCAASRATRTCSSTICCGRKWPRRIRPRCTTPPAMPPPTPWSIRRSTTTTASTRREAQKAHMYPNAVAQPGLHARAQPHLDALQDRVDDDCLRRTRAGQQALRRFRGGRQRLAAASSAARSSACSAPRAAARPRCCACWRASRRRVPGGC